MGKLVFGQCVIAVEIVQLHLRRRRQPKIRVLQPEKIGGELRQLPRTHQRGGVHQEWRQNLRIAVLAGMHIQKEIRQSPLQARSPALIHRETRAGRSFAAASRSRIPALSPTSQCGFGAKSNFGGAPHRRTSCVFLRAFALTARSLCGMFGIVSKNSRCVASSCADSFVDLLDSLRHLLHFRDQRVGVFFCFLQPRDFVAGFVALRF